MEESMAHVYNEVFQIISEMIPEDWDNIKLYAQLGEDFGEVFFYYFPTGQTTPIYYLDITSKFNVDQDEFDDLHYSLYKSFRSLWDLFVENDQEPWTNLTLTLSSAGKLSIQYNYDDLSDHDPYEDHIIWKYEVLGLKTDGDRENRILEDYLNKKA